MGKGGCLKNDGPVNTKAAITPEDVISTTKQRVSSSSKRLISHELLATKCTVKECWVAYEGNVYDVTHWLSKHPGGMRSIMSAAGRDATSVMKSLHAPRTLDHYMRRVRRVGVLKPKYDFVVDDVINTDDGNKDQSNDCKRRQINALKRAKAIENDFSALNDKLLRDGWFEAKPLYYWAAIIRALGLLATGVYLVLQSQQENGWVNNSYPWMFHAALVGGSILIGLFFQNIAFMGHDAGHGSITGSFHLDVWIGLIIGSALTGIDIGWWKSTHYVHHSATNSIHDDPDIQHLPLLCLEERMAEGDNGSDTGRWSTYHGRLMFLDKIGKVLIPYQHFYFYPVMAVARVNLYIQSIIYVIQTCPFRSKKLSSNTGTTLSQNANTTNPNVNNDGQKHVKEIYDWPRPSKITWLASCASLMVFYFLMYTLLSQLSLASAIACFAVSHMMAGLLHVQIMLSHIAMEYCIDGSGAVGANAAPKDFGEVGYYEWQARSTMDIACSPKMDWFHGGLQFQLEHHLFPRVPRWNLRKLMPLVDEIFQKYDIPVVRMGFYEGNCVMMRHIADIGSKVVKSHKQQ